MNRTVPDWLVMRAARRPTEPALRARSATWTRRQLLDAADGLAAALAGEGIEAGARVATLVADDAPAVALIEASRRLGCVLAPLNRRASPAELADQVSAAGVAVLVHDRAGADVAASVSDGASVPVATLRLDALMAGSPCGPRPPLRDGVDLEAPALIVFTSGTTGRPKGAVLTHGNLAASAHAWASVLRPRPATDRWLACLPLYHVAGLAIVTRATRWGVELVVHERFDALEVGAALEDGVSHISLVPVQLDQVMAARHDRPAPSSLRAVLLGGGPVPGQLLARARAEGYPVLTTYGMTETASGVVVGGADAATLADPGAGRPLPGVEVAVAGAGAPAGPGGPGEILVRGAMVFAGYVDAPGATAERLRDGWLHSGDIGTLDEGGLLRVLDRRDDLLVSGGENVYPAEVERVLREHPDVVDAAVIGGPDPRWGAVPLAAVVMSPHAMVTDADLGRHCRARLAGYKVPARFVRLASLPRDSLGKVRRDALRETLLEREA